MGYNRAHYYEGDIKERLFRQVEKVMIPVAAIWPIVKFFICESAQNTKYVNIYF